MLNSQGGDVLFGVTDKGGIVGQIVSTKTIEELANEFRKIDPQITPAIETVDLGNGLDRSSMPRWSCTGRAPG